MNKYFNPVRKEMPQNLCEVYKITDITRHNFKHCYFPISEITFLIWNNCPDFPQVMLTWWKNSSKPRELHSNPCTRKPLQGEWTYLDSFNAEQTDDGIEINLTGFRHIITDQRGLRVDPSSKSGWKKSVEGAWWQWSFWRSCLTCYRTCNRVVHVGCF